jgi:hypothetical protein
MKIRSIGRVLIACLPFLLSACSKQEEPAAPAAQKPATTPSVAAEEASKAASAAVTEAKPATAAAANQAAQTADNLKSTTSEAAAGTSAQIQSWFDKIKGLINEKKYPEALTALSNPPSANLTAEQQRLVDQLKTQVQDLLAKQSTDQGLKAVGGLLNKKK